VVAPSDRSLLVTPDLYNTVLAAFEPFNSTHTAYTAYGAQLRDAAQVSRSRFNG
jgi:hypothetical protein